MCLGHEAFRASGVEGWDGRGLCCYQVVAVGVVCLFQ